jgi:hypothetical protein
MMPLTPRKTPLVPRWKTILRQWHALVVVVAKYPFDYSLSTRQPVFQRGTSGVFLAVMQARGTKAGVEPHRPAEACFGQDGDGETPKGEALASARVLFVFVESVVFFSTHRIYRLCMCSARTAIQPLRGWSWMSCVYVLPQTAVAALDIGCPRPTKIPHYPPFYPPFYTPKIWNRIKYCVTLQRNNNCGVFCSVFSAIILNPQCC